MRSFVITLIAGLLLAAPASGNARATSTRVVEVAGERITLGDLSPTAPRELFGLDVAPAPAPGAKTQVSRAAVADALRRAGADPELATALPSRQSVQRASTTIDAETLEEEVKAKLLGELPVGVEIQSVLGLREVVVPLGDPRIDVKLGKLRRSTIATVDVSVGTRRWAQLRATVHLSGDAQTPVLAGDVDPGTTITDEHVKLAKVDLDALPEGAAMRADQLVGKRMKTRQRASAPLRKSATEELPVITRGSVVVVVAKMPGLRVTRKAVAQQDGAKGETIRLKLDDGGTLLAEVHGPGEVRVGGIGVGR